MLTHLNMQAGSSKGKQGLTFELAPVTVFVGPNNSGKSRALIEIENYVTKPNSSEGQVIKSVIFYAWDSSVFKDELQKISVEPTLNDRLGTNQIMIEKLLPHGDSTARFPANLDNLIKDAVNPNDRGRFEYANYLELFTLRLDGRSRLSLIEEQSAGDLQKSPENHLSKLFIDNEARIEVRRIVHDAIGKYLVIDPTNVGRLRFRLSDREPEDDSEEQGWDERSRNFHANADLISESSDGVKAFVGMLTTLIAGEPHIMLIDEPEAFLHSTLSARLGREVTTALKESNKRLFVATHSSSFLMGCVQSGVPVNIVRLTHDGSSSTARLLHQDQLIPLMRNPLLRSIGVLDGLFFNAVVVTEADADRAFYQEINERLLHARDPRGIGGCLFLNAQNKQTVWDIVHPLRMLGIPTVGIVDIDVIKDGGKVWDKPMTGAFIPSISRNSFNVDRTNILEAFRRTGKDMKRDGGISLLAGDEFEACENFLSKLADYGVFVVPTGEIESWLTTLEIDRGKASWLNTIFEKMGSDPSDHEYVHPVQGDVWDFIGRIAEWVKNPHRKGIPD